MVRFVFLLSLLMMMGCGTRRVATTVDKDKIKVEEKTKIDSEVKVEVEAKKEATKQTETTQKTNQSETQTKVIKIKEYAENGALRREIESNEAMSKVVEEQLNQKEKSLEISNNKIKILQQEKQELQTKLNQKTKEKSKETESIRQMIWLYVLVYILGVATIPTIKRLAQGKL